MFQYVATEEYVEYLGLVYELDLGHHFLTSQFYKDKFYLCDDVDSNLNMFHYTILLEYVDTKLIGKTAQLIQIYDILPKIQPNCISFR